MTISRRMFSRSSSVGAPVLLEKDGELLRGHTVLRRETRHGGVELRIGYAHAEALAHLQLDALEDQPVEDLAD
jgi:hypothetical protein